MYPQPPSHLSQSAAAWWRSCVERFVLEEHHFRLLQLCCEAWDRAQAAREQIDREGLTYSSPKGDLRPHPAIAIERDARLAVARLVRELDLDTEPARDPLNDIRPPALPSNRGDARARKASAS
jgi:P27 family predicted phage terminase small subunit